MLMLLTKFVPYSTIRRCCSSINVKNYEYDAKLAPNIMQVCTTTEPSCEEGTLKVLALKCANDKLGYNPLICL